MWSVFGDYLLTADATAKTYFQKVKALNNDIIVKACRTYVIIDNNPSFTSLNMKVYSDNGGVPGALIMQSTNSPTKASILTLNSALKEIYFTFNNLILKRNSIYHFVLNASGYTGAADGSSNIAWKHSYPDPAYQSNVDMRFEAALVSPYDLLIIGDKL